MFWFILCLFITGVLGALSYYYYKNGEDTNFVKSVLLFLSFGIVSYVLSSTLEEITEVDYDYIVKSKEECFKYQSCKEILNDILADGKVKRFEFAELKNELKNKMGE